MSINDNATIPFDAVEFDTHTAYDATTNFEFTAPVAGLYHFIGQINVNDGLDRDYELLLRVNATGIAREALRAVGGGFTTFQVSKIVNLSAGDVVDLRFIYMAGGPISQNVQANKANSYFQGYLIRH